MFDLSNAYVVGQYWSNKTILYLSQTIYVGYNWKVDISWTWFNIYSVGKIGSKIACWLFQYYFCIFIYINIFLNWNITITFDYLSNVVEIYQKQSLLSGYGNTTGHVILVWFCKRWVECLVISPLSFWMIFFGIFIQSE